MLFLFSCSSAKDALQGKKRSDNSDEFLVEKKNPLTVPPDIDELPVPLDQEEQNQTESQEDVDIKKVLKIDENQDTNVESNNENLNSLEESILEIFNKYNDKRLKYFLANKHTSLSEARALAIDNSKGEVITFLDVDDYWKDAILETQVSLYKDDDVVFSCGNFYILTEHSKKTRVFKKGKI